MSTAQGIIKVRDKSCIPFFILLPKLLPFYVFPLNLISVVPEILFPPFSNPSLYSLLRFMNFNNILIRDETSMIVTYLKACRRGKFPLLGFLKAGSEETAGISQ